jgi:hypothetical protein
LFGIAFDQAQLIVRRDRAPDPLFRDLHGELRRVLRQLPPRHLQPHRNFPARLLDEPLAFECRRLRDARLLGGDILCPLRLQRREFGRK